MSALRRRAFAWVPPLVLGLLLLPPLALATNTTGTNKTIGGGFTGGTVSGATTFSSEAGFAAGSAGAPSIAWTADQDGTGTGLFRSAANSIGFAANGTEVVRIGTTFLNLLAGTVQLNAGTAVGNADVGLQRTAAGVWKITNGAAGAGMLQVAGSELALNANYTNATASFTNTALSATLVSGRTYSFDLVLFFDDSTAADGAQFDFNGGGATITNFRAHCTAANNAGAALVITNAATTALATAVQVALALTTQSMLECHGTVVPSSSSTFIVRAAQTAHSAGTLTVDRGSWLNIRDANPL